MTKASANSGARTNSLRKPKKRTHPIGEDQDSADTLYTVRDIIAERRSKNGKLEYKIDWENDPVTGKSYSPSWVGTIQDKQRQGHLLQQKHLST